MPITAYLGVAMHRFVMVCSALLAMGCGDNAADISGTGIFSLGVTDAPVDSADAVVVTFTEVQLLGGDDELLQSFVPATPRQIDLLSLAGGLSELLVDAEVIPAGRYQQIRLLIDAPSPSCQNPSAPFASFITIDGTEFPLVVPSGAQSGLKLNGPIDVPAGGAAAYTIDFDLRRSVTERGNTGCFNLRPSLRLVENDQIGGLRGEVAPELLTASSCTADPATGEGSAVYLYAGDGVAPDDLDGSGAEVLTSLRILAPTGTDTNFSYAAGFLPPGPYTVAFSCQAGDDRAEQDDDIEFSPAQSAVVVVGNETTVNFTGQEGP